jgi:hypothetical protein
MGKFSLPAPKNFALQNSSQRYRRALSGLFLDATSWPAPRSGGRRAPKALPLESVCARANVVSLSLHSFLRGNEHIQTLRWRFDSKTPTRKTHAICENKNPSLLRRALFHQNFKQNETGKNIAK